ncbi:phosphopantetheine adenylyltransferase [Roseibium sediminicola]|uniref:Phosphopantetheine adenylyltransferase n=1 Tax=Roseibium sediminicola TaxID=2933272 RepID=A0ABT0GPM5_9HYPH|nr:phosphopantetheine adenylyltransferase [Roseibium sp. CAU 1639]MCK7611387.1 phosphopantetheine adenylyltransferase [Roseibium sp. CAU 1639]
MTTSPRTAPKSAAQPFSFSAKAVDPAFHVKMAAVFVLALLTMIAAGVMTMHPSNASQAEDLTRPATQGLTTTKSDRIASSQTTETCKTQAWGAWSEDCAAALSGANRVRNVSFVTVEKATPTVNETILTRYPTAN